MPSSAKGKDTVRGIITALCVMEVQKAAVLINPARQNPSDFGLRLIKMGRSLSFVLNLVHVGFGPLQQLVMDMGTLIVQTEVTMLISTRGSLSMVQFLKDLNWTTFVEFVHVSDILTWKLSLTKLIWLVVSEVYEPEKGYLACMDIYWLTLLFSFFWAIVKYAEYVPAREPMNNTFVKSLFNIVS